jgi:hypothetical protein
MRSSVRWAGLLLVLGLALPVFGADPPKAGDKPDQGPKLVPLGEMTGVLKSTGGSEAGLTLHVTLKYVEANAGAEVALLRDQQELLLRQRQIMMTRNPVWRQQAMIALVQEAQRMQQDKQNLFRVKQIEKDVEIQPADEMRIRSLHPPVAFDEKGNPKKYTAQELKEMRGDGKLPGYAAELTGLQDGQVVTVHLARKKDAAKPKDPKDKDKKDPPADEKPLATMIVIVADPQTGK